MKTILIILWVSGSYAGGATSHEFDSRQTCEAAAKVMQNDKSLWGHVHTYCVEK